MKLNEKLTTEELKSIWNKTFNLQNSSRFHIDLIDIFNHKNFQNVSDRMDLLMEVSTRNTVLYGQRYHANGFSWSEKHKFYHTSIPHLLKSKALSISERKYIIDYFLTKGDGMSYGLKDNSMGTAFKKGYLTFDEMAYVMDFCNKNDVNMSYIDFGKSIRYHIDNKNEKSFEGMKKVFDALSDSTLYLKQIANLAYELRNYYGVDKHVIKNVVHKIDTTQTFRNKVTQDYIEMLQQIHNEKKAFSLMTTPIRKLKYMLAFSTVMSEADQVEIISLVRDKRFKSLIEYLRYSTRDWYVYNIDIKGEALDIYNSVVIMDKLMK